MADEATPGPAPRRLSAAEEQTLAGLLDEIVPPSDDGRLPGAGSLGLAAHLEQVLRAHPELEPALREGLAVLEELAREHGAARFAALDAGGRRRVLNELATRAPALLPGLIFHTYVGYYQHPRVLEGLGLEARPPFPQGYAVEPSDFETLLAPVRRRGRSYREG